MITDLLSASALPASLTLGVNLRSSGGSRQPPSMAPSMISPALFSPQSNGLPSGATASSSTSSSRGLASPSSHHQSTHSSSLQSNHSSSSSSQLYRYMKQQYHLPDKLDLIDLSGEANLSFSAKSPTFPNDQLGICAACDLAQYTTFGPFSAKIAKTRQDLSNENIALKVSVAVSLSHIEYPFLLCPFQVFFCKYALFSVCFCLFTLVLSALFDNGNRTFFCSALRLFTTTYELASLSIYF